MYRQDPVLVLPEIEGHTFVCGDVHGCFEALEDQLDRHGFRPDRDRLICVGDLIDRGPSSERALEFLAEPWFHSVLGNHDWMMLEVLSGRFEHYDVWQRSGGEWARHLYDDQKLAWFRALGDLPLAIETRIDGLRIGIVHADVSPDADWDTFCRRLRDRDRDTVSHAIWGRMRISSGASAPVEGIDLVYAGHTIVERPVWRGNVCFVDTGAFLDNGTLTVLRLPHPPLAGSERLA